MKVRPALLVIKDNAVLTMKYTYGETNLYNLPGGNPDRGETLSEALWRELREELGVSVSVGDLIMMGDVSLPHQKEDVLHCVFVGEILSGEPIVNPAETSAKGIVWQPIEVLHHLDMYPNVGSFVQEWAAQGLSSPYLGRINQRWIE
jgi:8-oxo-dGTP diphosphatase